MPKIRYEHKRLSADKLATIDKANEIIAEYTEQGYSLTLRQLYYQFVSRDLIPNKQSEYKRLGDIISDGRRAGLIDWNAIEDRTRNLRRESTWDDPQDLIRCAADGYAIDLWKMQEYRIEVWVEKDALIGVLEVACRDYQLPYFSCRGYTSDSEIWAAGQRLKKWYKTWNQTPIVLHLGDHDPSGVDMTRDIRDRLHMFGNDRIVVERIALTMDQIDEHRPPPNPAKTTDARFDRYQKLYGDESWELDALDPTTITEVIHGKVREYLIEDEFEDRKRQQEKERSQLQLAADNWDKITRLKMMKPEE